MIGNKEGKKEARKKNRKGETDEREVKFRFYAPDAQEVYLAGDFNGWHPQELLMKKSKDGTWEAKVKLPPGKHEYKLLVDRRWVHDVPTAELVANPFGTQNCVIWVSNGQ